MFYYGLFGLIVLSSFYVYFVNRSYDKYTFNFWIVVLFFVSSFRYETGNDWYTYQLIFELSPKFSFIFIDIENYLANLKDIEIGYRILNSIVKSIGGNLQTIFLITGAFSFISLKKFINENSDNKTLSLLLYYSIFFFNFNMSIIRQGIALSIFLLSIRFIRESKLWKYLTMIILASLFHSSSLVLLPVYFLTKVKFSKKVFSYLLIMALTMRLLEIRILNTIISFLPMFIKDDLMIYMTPDNYIKLITFGNIERLFMCLLIIIFSNKIINKSENVKLFLHFYIIYVMLNFILFENEVLVSRIRFYFQISYIVILPIFIDILKRNYVRLTSLVSVIIFSYIPIINFLSNDINNTLYNPYQNLIIHKYLLDVESTGNERFEKIIKNLN